MKTRRSLAAALSGVATSLVLAAAGSAAADPSNSARGLSVIVDAHNVLSTDSFAFSQAAPINRPSQLEAGTGQPNSSAGATTFLDTTTFVGANAHGVSVHLEGDVSRNLRGEAGTSSATAFAQSEMHDTLTIAGDPTGPQQVVVHRRIELFGSLDAFLPGLSNVAVGDNSNGSASVSLVVNGTDLTFADPLSETFSVVHDHSVEQGFGGFDRIFDIAMTVNINTPTDFDMFLLNQVDTHMTDASGNGHAAADFSELKSSADAFADARFIDGADFTDLSGNRITGLSITAASHADWTTGVPEPSTWALAIVGFGLAGRALRRRAPLRSA